eukprot:1196356-Prorocentrum_minimum.AAC.3
MVIHLSHPPGDILIFMTGQEEIETVNPQALEPLKLNVGGHCAITHQHYTAAGCVSEFCIDTGKDCARFTGHCRHRRQIQ